VLVNLFKNTMVSKKYNSDLFGFLDWILKKKIKEPNSENLPNPFITNKWLSMADPMIAQIINATTNKWIMEEGLASDSLYMGKFLRTILPKHIKNISYIKKSDNEKERFYSYIGNNELSLREIQLYEKTLAELKIKTK
jgi:hypothetical protein